MGSLQKSVEHNSTANWKRSTLNGFSSEKCRAQLNSQLEKEHPEWVLFRKVSSKVLLNKQRRTSLKNKVQPTTRSSLQE